MEITAELLIFVFLVGIFAGWVDSIAGGGGLISLPALLFVGLNPLAALATNKLQSSFGAFIAAVNYTRLGWVDLQAIRWLVLVAFIASAAGTMLVQHVDLSLLERLLPVLLGLLAAWFALSPRVGDLERTPRLGGIAYGATAVPAIGFYDGFFGPGTGSFFTASAISLLGASARRAVGLTKVLNFTTNFSSLILFVIGGQVIWSFGLAMVLGQVIGAWFGSSMAIRNGVAIIRPIVVVVCLAVMIRMLYQQYLL
ncbi:MAG: TSUP family transporter [Aquisalimonadaceae bacterium]